MRDEAALFKALADPIRLRLAALLAIRGETCVCDLAQALDEPDYKISKHLTVLRSAGMVDSRREGAWMQYRLAESRSELESCLQQCFRDCLSGHATVRKDLERLANRTCRKPEDCLTKRSGG
ncbi:MAG: hypothetical protein BWZ10_00231 [candidate division BRC1 bacterium ADurb.BinA364]|nr:MAG: hypothetical protein BWZ10_00231 [candidate division BRC1 bacterium ADurb.BinA364]